MGVGLNCLNSGGGSAYLSGTAPDAFKTWTSLTLFSGIFRGDDSVPYGNNSDILGITYDTNDNSPFAVAALNQNQYYFSLAWNTGGSYTTTTTVVIPQNAFNTLAGIFTVGGNAVAYMNGAQAASATFGASAPSTTASSMIDIGTYYFSGTTRNVNSIVLFSYAWNRALSANEIQTLDKDPYCFLIFPEDEMFAFLTGAAAVGDTLFIGNNLRFM